MEKLLKEIKRIRKSKVKKLIEKRKKEFEKNKQGAFSELCFCILTANFNAQKAIAIQKAVGSGFQTFSKSDLAKKLRQLGHRYPNARAKYIVEARKHGNLKNMKCSREWLVKNVKGLGMKEASHFLRNVGYKDVAIIDFHIIDLLAKHKLIKKPKARALAKKRYLEIENLLKKIAKRLNLNLAELDLYLWFIETGKVLK